MNRKNFLNVLGPGLIGIFLGPNIGTTHHIPPCPGNVSKADEEKILESLFCITSEDVRKNTGYHYNGYGCNKDSGLYEGGHPGWDAYHEEVNHEFYCLTPGMVIANGGDSENTIAIYDRFTNTATLYLHASAVHPSIKTNMCVGFGVPLGQQGNTSHRKDIGAHVHIEVRTLQIPYAIQQLAEPSHGTEDGKRETMDPIPYLLKSVQLHARPKAGPQCTGPQCMVWAAEKKR